MNDVLRSQSHFYRLAHDGMHLVDHDNVVLRGGILAIKPNLVGRL